MSKIKVAILFGGVSAEHEVSIITGLQVLEQIDRDKYDPLAIYLNKEGLFRYYPSIKSRKGFSPKGGEIINFAKDEEGVYLVESKPFAKKKRIDVFYLAFHGGNGESGQFQGFAEVLGIAYTSPSAVSSSICMNKALTKEVLHNNNISSVESVTVGSDQIKNGELNKLVASIQEQINFHIIIKPVHLGSSIGINIAKTKIELKKYLLEAAFIDSEILVEKLLKDFTEYNCAVRLIDGKLEASEVERPIHKDEILSFADKYQRGGKKQSGMASLNRELPANITESFRQKIQEMAKNVFVACRCKGMVRIDFMATRLGKIYVTEVNPIPGSMAFYLWEATGISFTQQITDLVEQAIKDNELVKSRKLDYESDIVE